MILVCPECGSIECVPGKNQKYQCRSCTNEFDLVDTEVEQFYFGPMPIGMKEKDQEAVFHPEQKCRVCGCTWKNACMTPDGPCHWVGPDLCSACAKK